MTRRVILEAAADAQLAVTEQPFTPAEALLAREAFISSATGVYPVTSIDGKPIGNGRPGAVTRRVQELYQRTSAMRAGAAEDRP